MKPAPMHPSDQATVIRNTQRWIERAVIGLNLCPFAAPIYGAGTLYLCVSRAQTPQRLLAALADALSTIAQADRTEHESTLLIHPDVLSDFQHYNDFLEQADQTLERMSLSGVIQIASFHPDYQFADTDRADVSNCTNRSPYPMLHLLREQSVSDALARTADPDAIPRRNIETLQRLGMGGWQDLWKQP